MARLDLDIRVLQRRSEFDVLKPQLADRRAYELSLNERYRDRDAWSDWGYCEACDRPREMCSDWRACYGGEINFREQLVCTSCGLGGRLRFVAGRLRESATTTASVLILEQHTGFAHWAASSLSGDIRCTAPQTASPGAAAFDVVVANEVLHSHMDLDSALSSCADVLREAGWLYFTVPFRADADASSDDHATFGWDLLDRCRTAGFAAAFALGYWSTLYGYLGHGIQLAFAARTAIGARGTSG